MARKRTRGRTRPSNPKPRLTYRIGKVAPLARNKELDRYVATRLTPPLITARARRTNKIKPLRSSSPTFAINKPRTTKLIPNPLYPRLAALPRLEQKKLICHSRHMRRRAIMSMSGGRGVRAPGPYRPRKEPC